MKRYKITIEGVAYEVEVEELGAAGAGAAQVIPGVQGGTDARQVTQHQAGDADALQAAGSVGTPVPQHNVGAASRNTASAPAPQSSSALGYSADTQPSETPGSTAAVTITAPMPGTILAVEATAGQQVKAGDILLILEAMKMENEILAPEDGRVTSVTAVKGASVNAGDVLVEMAV